MTLSSIPRFPVENWEKTRDEWIAEVDRLIADLERWAARRDWGTRREDKEIVEDGIGAYRAPVLTIQAPTGRVYFNPVAREVLGASGRIELYATPSFAEAVLLHRDGAWRFYSGDLDDLNLTWSEQALDQIIPDLMSRP
jgi:hypothetical protein